MIHKKGYITIIIVLLVAATIVYLEFGGIKTVQKQRTIEEVKERNEDWLMNIDEENITGVGIEELNGELVIIVMVKEKTHELNRSIPKEIEGYKVVIEETGEIIARK
ncbi:hypothetical protein ig2599ANME_2378 [groundwater metagenome]